MKRIIVLGIALLVLCGCVGWIETDGYGTTVHATGVYVVPEPCFRIGVGVHEYRRWRHPRHHWHHPRHHWRPAPPHPRHRFR